ncbi:hypothetical protein F5Y14DRAFT_171229 [Nemania sp. NC0429]|nr:hypothetical protein F5Y14DRAFT_171229 [Nemania sp. NC0429]
MALYETVGGIVAALVESYASAIECYAAWREMQRRRNHHRLRGTAAAETRVDVEEEDPMRLSVGTMCAATSSLSLARARIQDAFDSGADVLGEEFVSGEAACREVLLENLARLQDSVAGLKRTVNAGDPRYHLHPQFQPLPLAEVIFVSEAVRVSSLAALHKQYQRLVVGRLMPRGISPPKRSSIVLRRDEGDGGRGKGPYRETETEAETEMETDFEAERALTPTERNRPSQSLKRLSRNSGSATNCEPPSPPLTPTRVSKEHDADYDVHSAYSRTATATTRSDPRPKNSVFSVFCPEALKYQVDLEKSLPANGMRCWCGYDWKAECCAGGEKAASSVIKDGFRITPRFLGKSHCESGLGCVLCTSSGRTETFSGVEGLKAHINSSHTKWQLLHDRDLAERR